MDAQKKPLYKRAWFVIVACLIALVILGKIVEPSKEEKARILAEEAKKKTADSLVAVAKKEEEKRKKDSADAAFDRLPQKEKDRILKEQKAKSIKQSMADILSDNEKEFHIQYIAQEYIKKHLKNPDSFERKQISKPKIVVDKKGEYSFQLMLTYSATNSFGGIIQESKYVTIDQTGSFVVEVIDIQ